MKRPILLICLVVGFSYVAEAVRRLNNDQDNFQWVSDLFRGNTNNRAGCDTCECGKSKVARNPVDLHRIVGGIEAIKYSHPWLSSLYFKPKGLTYCGATIINSKHVLTAAHCDVVPMGDIRVRTHVHRLADDGHEEHAVEAIMRHESYNNKTYENDIAVMRLSDELDFSDKGDRTLVPICREQANELYVGTIATVAGWGRLKSKGAQAEELRETSFPIQSDETCKKSMGRRIKEHMMCAGYPQGGKDSCEGDSGGPLIIEDPATSKTYQVGIVSFGFKCARPKLYGVYTRVNHYTEWIDNQIQGGCTCSS